MQIKMLKQKEVLKKTSFGKTTLYKLIGKNLFPAPAKLTPSCVAWDEAEVNDWLKEKLAERHTVVMEE